MSPGHIASVALEDAGGLGSGPRLPVVAGHDRVVEDRVLRAVEPGRHRFRQSPGGVLTGVDEVEGVPRRRGVHVRHEDLRERALVEHRAVPLAVFVANLRDDQTDPWIDPVTEAPVAPAHSMPIQLEARAERLLHCDGRPLLSPHCDRVGVVARLRRRHRNGTVIDHLDHLAGVHVHQHGEPGDQAMVGESPRPPRIDAHHLGDPTTALLIRAKIARREPVAGDIRIVAVPAAPHRFLPLGALHGDRPGDAELGVQPGRLHARHLFPARQLPPDQIDLRLERPRALLEDGEGGARHRLASRPGQHHSLVGWGQRHQREACEAVDVACRPQHLEDGPVLVPGERIHWMLN